VRRFFPFSRTLLVVLALNGAGGVGACSIGLPACDFHRGGQGERRYELLGQVLRVNKDEGTVTIRHEDIKGFMPAMTMPFKVKDKHLLDRPVRGDLVKGTLVVTDTDAYLVELEVTAHAEIAPGGAAGLARPGTEEQPANVLTPGELVPDIRLIDTAGRNLRLSSLRGSVVALTFVYTRCPLPQFCPLLDRQFAAVGSRLRDNARLRESVRLLSISFDPEYDTPAVLAVHARAVGADGVRWQFATADRPALDALAPRFGLVVVREADNSITHNMRTAIVDRQGRLTKIYDGTDWTVDQMMADLEKAAGAR
jgi:protein SCO1/2